MAEGWIKLHRAIRKNWIWEDAQKLKWWLDIILQANHQERKVLLGNELVVVERGSFHTSELKLAKKWGVSKTTVRKFLELLESDRMITTIKSKKGTTLKVSNYEDYQGYTNEEDVVPKSEKTTNEDSNTNGSDMVFNNEKTILKPPKTTKNLTDDKITQKNKPPHQQNYCKNSTTNEDSNTNGLDVIFKNEKTIKKPQKNHSLDHKRTIEEPQKNHKVDTNKNDKELYKNYKNEEEGKEGEENPPSTPPLSFPTPYHEVIYNQWTENNYRTWFMNSDIEDKENEIVISVKSEFVESVINEKFKKQLDILLGKKVVVSLKEI
ncbi:DnaA N-terminal domain-containing protein [Clostridium sp. UBA1056]|uniref:DnaA N-terminal domain-containing protein n=1 Tax=unclassified Clostridium TaxID=2614128 RepID=UPI003216749D